MPLVINSLGRGHTNTHTDDSQRINFKKPGMRRPGPACAWFKKEVGIAIKVRKQVVTHLEIASYHLPASIAYSYLLAGPYVAKSMYK